MLDVSRTHRGETEEDVVSSPGRAAFAALASQLQNESESAPDEVVTARTIVDRAREVVEDADAVSLTVVLAEGRYATLASTDDVAGEADGFQYDLDEGPCVEAAECTSWFRSGDVGSDPRWPRWGSKASSLGVSSVLSVRLTTHDGRAHGALNFYSVAPDAFSDAEAIDLAQVYTVHAANALSTARLVCGLQTALTSRHTIGIAQGILMERFGLDQQHSFELLRRTSSVHNIKLRDVAARVVETGALPDDGSRS
jgi:hypothetical protein